LTLNFSRAPLRQEINEEVYLDGHLKCVGRAHVLLLERACRERGGPRFAPRRRLQKCANPFAVDIASAAGVSDNSRMNLRAKSLIIVAALCATQPPARADDAPTAKPSAEQVSLEGYAATAPLCLEWSDGCATCARDDKNSAHCSTPGIACQPGPIVCRKEK